MAFRSQDIALVVAMTLVPAVACAEVFKCVDGAGRITYQESACASGERGGAVVLPEQSVEVRESPEVEAAWRAAATRHEVIKGMPKRWVQQALGVPAAMRPGTPTDAATEVWSYELPAGTTRVGFSGNLVAWQRTEPRAAKASPVGDARGAAAAPTAEPRSIATSPAAENADAVRSRVAVDRKCDEVLAELGPAASQQNIQLTAGADGVRYTYDPVAGGLPVRLTFTCADGRVVAVSRGVPR
jgi:hypothetical protein